MQEIELRVMKGDAIREAAMTAGYTGKLREAESAGAYERMALTEADEEQMERFWQECRSEATSGLADRVSAEEESDGVYHLWLRVPDWFETGLEGSMGLSLRNFFVRSMLAKWFAVSNKAEAAEYAESAAAMLADVKGKACRKRRPVRID